MENKNELLTCIYIKHHLESMDGVLDVQAGNGIQLNEERFKAEFKEYTRMPFNEKHDRLQIDFTGMVFFCLEVKL